VPDQRTSPEDRYALYYPRIHISSEHWLKGTLLSFRQVRRIIPQNYTVKDRAVTEKYTKLKGSNGEPLLQAVSLNASPVRQSQTWLRKKINGQIDALVEKYAEGATPPELQSGPKAFEMHARKFVDEALLDLLTSKGLAWYSRESGEPDSDNWVTIHPTLGSAVMSVLALAIARGEGLSVVTYEPDTHQELLANREEDVFDRLIGNTLAPGADPEPDVTVEELAHVVLTTGFDLTRLTPEQIEELLKEGKDLSALRSKLAEFASRIPEGLGPEERAARIKTEAQAVLEDWNKYTSHLPPFAKEALVDASLDKIPDLIAESAKEVAAEGLKAAILGAISWPTMAITVVGSAGVKMFRKRDTPLRFLTRVNSAVDRSIGSIYVPRFEALAEQSAP
jgi:hypothetical protein